VGVRVGLGGRTGVAEGMVVLLTAVVGVLAGCVSVGTGVAEEIGTPGGVNVGLGVTVGRGGFGGWVGLVERTMRGVTVMPACIGGRLVSIPNPVLLNRPSSRATRPISKTNEPTSRTRVSSVYLLNPPPHHMGEQVRCAPLSNLGVTCCAHSANPGGQRVRETLARLRCGHESGSSVRHWLCRSTAGSGALGQ